MSEHATKKSSATDWARVDALTDESVDTTDIPPLPDSFFERASLRQPRTRVTVAVDAEVLAWFKAQGSDWEQRLNAALRLYAEVHKAASR